jgi:hypothetical protein
MTPRWRLPGRWSAWVSLRRATWQLGPLSLVHWMARSGKQFWQGLGVGSPHIVLWRSDSGIAGDPTFLERCEGFLGKILAFRRQWRQCLWGIVTISRASLWVYLLRTWSPSETLDRRGLDNGGAMRRYTLGGIIVELGFFLVSFSCFRWQVLVLLIFFCLPLIRFVRGSSYHLVSVRKERHDAIPSMRVQFRRPQFLPYFIHYSFFVANMIILQFYLFSIC